MTDTGEIWRNAQREEDAALCRAAGCLCFILEKAGVAHTALFRMEGDDPDTVMVHDGRCPEALADAIEARGKE